MRFTDPPLAITLLLFRIEWHVSFKDKISCHDIFVSGTIFVCGQLKRLVKVGSVDFQQDDCKLTPVLAYLQRHCSPQGLPTPLTNNSYSLTESAESAFNAPLTNEPYSAILTPFMSTPTSLTTHLLPEPSLTVVDQCGYSPVCRE